MMKVNDFIDKAKLAVDSKTLYIKGCFGAPMNAKNKKRYSNNTEYNKKRADLIDACTNDTFGFDCVCLIKGILWGWNADKNKTYGGASYESNGVPDFGTEGMLNYCKDVSTDFTKIQKGEVLWLKGHAGIYIGNGLAIECTPKWTNDVQITAVKNIGTIKGYNSRKWTKHGKLKFIDYTEEPKEEWTPAIYELLYAKCIRKTHKITPTNIVQAKNCTATTKKHLVSQTGNAKLKTGTNITCKSIYNEKGRIWGSYGNCWIVLCNIDGTPQAKKIKEL